MNLILQPWLPIRRPDGRSESVSLEETLWDSSAIADLDMMPHERVSVMRLLVCLVQSAIGAPGNMAGWQGFGDGLEKKVVEYLHRPDVLPHFELFGDGHRFLQIKVPAKEESVPSSKLVPYLATGNNPTLFDHSASPGRRISPGRLALALLSFQNFYPLYGAGYKGRGPCADGNMVHTLLTGQSLRETILLNCLDAETVRSAFSGGMGRPIWELSGPKSEALATTTYLGRLVPRHRDLWLKEDGTGFSLRQQSYQYPGYPDGVREPTCTIEVKEKEGKERVLAARLNRAIWRDLDLITVLRKKSGELQASPLTLQSHLMEQGNGNVTLWSGALVTDLKAKILDSVESVFTVPHTMFTAPGRATYHLGVRHAEEQARFIWSAVKTFSDSLKNDSAPADEAQRHYWHSLDQQRQILLEIVANPASLSAVFGEGDDPWSKAVWQAALAAYRHVCPAGPAPRLFQAHAEGLKMLKPRKKTAKKVATPK